MAAKVSSSPPSPGAPKSRSEIKKARKKPGPLKAKKVVSAATSLPSPGPVSPLSTRLEEKQFRFLDLPGELRNRVYELTLENSQQALLTHLPRRATLRHRKEHANPARRLKRRYLGLLSTCRQIRQEYRLWYMQKQQIALDITDINKYLATFYPASETSPAVGKGNIITAISDRISSAEKNGSGIDLLPLLDTWSTALHIHAGFGWYTHLGHDVTIEAEAKDLYRLFCCQVLPDGHCGPFNEAWSAVLTGKKLAAVRIQRDPFTTEDPFIHLLFKPEHKEEWMNGDKLVPPYVWLKMHGFHDMEYYDVKVGVAGLLNSTPSLPMSSWTALNGGKHASW